ncbi:DUF4269 domain-containing protein [Novosphingobium beihaiensis]|uniref:DUF4269 domain-containing protein n=1 Tax=Novosphingobium beihaiensis TaxID=2930389 RepID=A0ABT0BP69_9SPHN|nr:DUF4269 domain-containing protein [Novosphingobium beihaiensis]MCJ2186750.1 DUF4269 domain-containing protein [Novosphingobium beihaiensis]
MNWREVLDRMALLARLAAFDVRVAGTFPLGIDVPGSDIDLLCHAPDSHRFAQAVWDACADYPEFAIYQWTYEDRPVVAGFVLHHIPFEIFGQAIPVSKQHGWRHFEVERRLLALGGDALREAVMAARMAGMKTEPAFAQVLGLEGDAYEALLELSKLDDQALRAVLPERMK